jgi:hypothetical protein
MKPTERQIIEKWEELYAEVTRQFKPYATTKIRNINRDIQNLELRLKLQNSSQDSEAIADEDYHKYGKAT